MPTCYVMTGLPASGKSTYVENMQNMDPDVFVYSTDNVLERIAEQLGKTYDDVFAKHIESAKAEMDIWLAEAMKHKLNIIWDQTNVGAKKRRGIVERMKNAGYQVEAICFNTPKTEQEIVDWNVRLHKRKGKTIPENILHNMIKSYAEPTLEEGFDKIATFNIYGDFLNEQTKDG